MRARVLGVGLLPIAALVSGCAFSTHRPSTPVFEALDTGVDVSLRGLSVASPDVVWASGARGTVIRSVDAGATWTRHRVVGAEDLDLRSIHAFDAQRAVCVSAGQPARFYRTVNGGRSFDLVWQCPHPYAFFDAVGFWDDARGIAFSDPIDGAFLIVVTDDGGATWRRVPPDVLPVPLAGEAGFAASGTCLRTHGEADVWIGTGGGAVARLLHSPDRGASWRVFELPIAAGDPAAGAFSIATDGDVVVVVGGKYDAPDADHAVAARGSPAAGAWVTSAPEPGGYRSAVACFGPGGPFVAVGRNGSDISFDGGASWQVLGSDAFQAVRAAPDVGRRRAVGFAVGAGGKAARVRF